MMVFGLMSIAFDLLTFFVLLKVFHADERTFQTAWFVVSLLTELAVLLVLRTHSPAWRSMPSPLLLCTTFAVVVAALVLPYSGTTAALFAFVPLSLSLIGSALLIVAGYVLTTEAVKLGLYSGKHKRLTAKVVAALQGHATEIVELADEGMLAMRHRMMRRTQLVKQGRCTLSGARCIAAPIINNVCATSSCMLRPVPGCCRVRPRRCATLPDIDSRHRRNSHALRAWRNFGTHYRRYADCSNRSGRKAGQRHLGPGRQSSGVTLFARVGNAVEVEVEGPARHGCSGADSVPVPCEARSRGGADCEELPRCCHGPILLRVF